ncbi:MAG TPA: hypothetical protein VHO24_15670 [Opitutaceae bacterium]|nr:hypothetical protein [Opitutaceae bacterium]
MNPTPDRDEKLERLIQQTLRQLPARRAPRTLENRVLAELERRAALPWWRKSYAYWPSPVRAAFFVVSATVAALIVAGVFVLTRGAAGTEAVGQLTDQVAGISSVFSTIVEKTLMIYHAIPAVWLYSAIALIGSCYAALLGIGAVAYRTIRANRSL